MSVLQNRIYYINSENRISGTSSNFTYQIDIPEGLRIDSCCVLSMTIPKSYYLVRNKYNQVTVTFDGVPFVVTVPRGNYTAVNFMPVLVSLLNDLKNPDGSSVGTFSMTRDTITGKYT